MASVSTNPIMNGLRGTFGNTLVFRQWHGKTLVSPKGRNPNKKKETAAQRNTRTTFKEATEWAQHILLDPQKKEYYKQRAKVLKLPNAYTAAITEYMRKPKVVKLEESSRVTLVVNKPGFTLQQVAVVSATTTPVKIRQSKTSWSVDIYKPLPEIITLEIFDGIRFVKFNI